MKLIDTLDHVWSRRVALKSNFVRRNTLEIATACSLGLITNITPDGQIVQEWHITTKGLELLCQIQDKESV